MSKGLRAPLSALFLLGYHTFVGHVFGKIDRQLLVLVCFEERILSPIGNGDGDLERSHVLVEQYLKTYPKVSGESLLDAIDASRSFR